MVSQAHLDKMTVRQNYRNLWHTDLMSTMTADPACKPSKPFFVYWCVNFFADRTDIFNSQKVTFYVFFSKVYVFFVSINKVLADFENPFLEEFFNS